MVSEKKYCKKCEALLEEGTFIASYEEFKDGFYCNYCARRKKEKINGVNKQ